MPDNAADVATPPPPPSATTPQRVRLVDQLIANTPIIAAVSVTLLFCLIIGSLFFPYLFGYQSESSLLRELASLDQARGLITFLVAVTTVGIALILTVYVVVTNDPNVKDRFILGKEVLTGLIGVLGTIVGFYFGSVATQTQKPATNEVKITKFAVEPTAGKVGDKFKVHVQTSGLKLPLQYTVSFNTDSKIADKAGTSTKDDFTEEFSIPASAAAGSNVEVSFALKDKSGTAADSKLLPVQSVKVIQ